MSKWSEPFEKAFKLTVDKTIQHRELTLPEIDSELADEIGWEPSRTRSLRGEWGDILDVRVFSGFIDEGGDLDTLTLTDGTQVEIRKAGHLNVDIAGASGIIYHLLDYAGVVYRDDGNGYELIGDRDIELLVGELSLID